MNTFHDQIQRCIRHPQQRIVGVCACCLQERLASLIESITPAHSREVEDAPADALNTSNLAAHELQPPPPSHRRFPNNDSSFRGTAEMAPHSLPKHEAALNLYLQNVKNAHHSVDFVDRSPKQSIAHTGMKAALVSSPHVLTTTQEKKNRSLPSSHRRSSASESNLKTDHLSSGNVDILGKKKGSWFSSMSKSRTSRLNSPMQQEGKKLSKDELRSPQLMISAGRKSASQAGDSTYNNYRQAYMADLEAIEEINLGETAIKLDNNIDGDVSTSSSWISSLFHRRKGLRSKSNLSNSTTSSNNTAIDEISAGVMLNGSINQSPKNSIDAGRLSWDGARPDFKQILRKVEARNKQQRGDCSPSHSVDYAMKQYNDNGREMKDQVSSLKKCKSVASARSSISVEMPKDLMQASSSPMIHQGQRNVMVGLDYDNLDDDRSFPRSRSWGRAWNRALSPLWGFKHHSRKGVNDSPSTHHHHHHHPGSVTPSHVNFKSSISVPPSSSSYVSPLRRSSLAPDARIHFAQ